ncbi:MAG TPA: GTPase ObgE [bacterium]|nr:GTPase ObgE [bacterium]HPN42550.1 GTPase ObgE [bacterium]
MFIDYAKIYVKAGDGGDGCIAFRREKYVPKGGPSGGDGGYGGNIVITASKHIHTLLDFRYNHEYKAERGQHGMGSNMTGKTGSDCIVKVPVGTLIIDADSGEPLADMVDDQQSVIIAAGGKGGRGNTHFKSATNQAPRICEEGVKGEEKNLVLELKLIADVGLVGMPNAGKSTLLSRISAARPKIADYPFTTLKPQLGIVKVREQQSFVAADIPGLIEGAHLGKGLGTQFLRHIERTKLLLIMLDACSENLLADYHTLINELDSYGNGLESKPRIIVYTKSDLLTNGFKGLSKRTIKNTRTLLISAITGENLAELKQLLWEELHNTT